MKISYLYYNWFFSPTDNVENYIEVYVGKDGVKQINEHLSCGEGDKVYYEIVYENGSMERIFHPCKVGFIPENKK